MIVFIAPKIPLFFRYIFHIYDYTMKALLLQGIFCVFFVFILKAKNRELLTLKQSKYHKLF